MKLSEKKYVCNQVYLKIRPGDSARVLLIFIGQIFWVSVSIPKKSNVSSKGLINQKLYFIS